MRSQVLTRAQAVQGEEGAGLWSQATGSQSIPAPQWLCEVGQSTSLSVLQLPGLYSCT